MTKEILKYMVVQPAAIVSLPKSCLLNVGYEVNCHLENCTKSKILKFGTFNTFPPDGSSERMCELRCFPSFQPFVLKYKIHCHTSANLLTAPTCRPDAALKFTVYLLVWTMLCSVEHGPVLETEQCADGDFDSLTPALKKTLWKLYFCLTIPVDKTCPVKFCIPAL